MSTIADLFFRNGAFVHHAFCVEGYVSPFEFFKELQKKADAPHFLTPYTKVVDTFTIDMTREILEISRKSYSKKAHQLIFISALIYTREAQNGLLKMLEEPQPSITIFIFTRHSNQLLDTIRSRTQMIAVRGESNEVMGEHARKLLSGSPVERLAVCESLINMFEKEEISRTQIATLVEIIEKNIHDKISDSQQVSVLKHIAELRRLLGMPSASVKQVVEGVATLLNLFD